MSATIRDTEAPMPYERRKPHFTAEEVKFSYEYTSHSTKQTVKTIKDDKGVAHEEKYNEITTETRVKKVTLKAYSLTSEEDVEHFFEAFERLQKELATVWTEASTAKHKDATILFNAIEKMLAGTANTQWHDVLGTTTERTWETFKTKMATFICKKVLPEDAYMLQVRYMQERVKPIALESKEWWRRMQTLNRYLVYCFPDHGAMKREFPGEDFQAWWRIGQLSEAQLRRIVTSKVPGQWQDLLRTTDIGHIHRDTKPIEDLVDYFSTLETLERDHSTRRVAGGRHAPARGHRQQNYYRGRGPNQNYSGRNPVRFSNPVRYNQSNYNPVRYYQRSPVRPILTSPVRPNITSPVRPDIARSTTGTRYNPGSYQRGGRIGNSTFGRNSGRFGGQRSGRGGFQQGRFQPQRPTSGGQVYYEQEQQGDAPEVQQEEVLVQEEEQEEGEQYAMEEQEQWFNRWNENLFVEADHQGEQYDESYGIDDLYDQGEEEYYDYAANTGSERG